MQETFDTMEYEVNDMGMTKVFYIVKKNQFTSEKIREKLSKASALDDLYYTVFYQETKDWFQVFDEYCCEGRYNADEAFMVSLEKTFGSMVIALSTFDSDAAFFSICENGELHRYVWADKLMLEEFGFEEYEPAMPTELENYVDGKALQKIWDAHYVLAEDFLRDIAQLLNAFLIFDENDVEEETEIIDSE